MMNNGLYKKLKEKPTKRCSNIKQEQQIQDTRNGI